MRKPQLEQRLSFALENIKVKYVRVQGTAKLLKGAGGELASKNPNSGSECAIMRHLMHLSLQLGKVTSAQCHAHTSAATKATDAGALWQLHAPQRCPPLLLHLRNRGARCHRTLRGAAALVPNQCRCSRYQTCGGGGGARGRLGHFTAVGDDDIVAGFTPGLGATGLNGLHNIIAGQNLRTQGMDHSQG